MRNNILEIKQLTKSFGETTVLTDIALTLEKGKTLSILGKSGCGKTTLLRCINFLEMPDKCYLKLGEIELENITGTSNAKNRKLMDFDFLSQDPVEKAEITLQKKISYIRNNVGFLYQSLNLFPHLKVIENITLPLRIVQKKSVEEANSIAIKFLQKVAMDSFKDRYPHQLSGGQAQRVAIARELARNPLIMLYDEPTSALDPELVVDFLKIVLELKQEGMSQIIVTHSLKVAHQASDIVCFMDKGRVMELTPKDEFFKQPQTNEGKKYLSIIHD